VASTFFNETETFTTEVNNTSNNTYFEKRPRQSPQLFTDNINFNETEARITLDSYLLNLTKNDNYSAEWVPLTNSNTSIIKTIEPSILNETEDATLLSKYEPEKVANISIVERN
jgi:hypothetical protein